MRIVLDLSGWKKEEEVYPDMVRNGIIEVELSPPISVLVNKGGTPSRRPSTSVIFRYNGKGKNGLPVFRWI